MGVKIKPLSKKITKLRRCEICEKMKPMSKFERFCSSLCRQAATEIDKYGSEFRVALSNKKG